MAEALPMIFTGLGFATQAASTAYQISSANKQREDGERLMAEQRSAQEQQMAQMEQEKRDAGLKESEVQKNLAARAQQKTRSTSGRSGTILTNQLGEVDEEATRKTLLGT